MGDKRTPIVVAGLPGHPSGVLAAADGSGPLYVPSRHDSAAWLSAVDHDGRVRWSNQVGLPAGGQPQVATDGTIWLSDRKALRQFHPDGSVGRRVEPRCADDEQLGKSLVLPDGFLFAWFTRPYRGARVERTDQDGARRWSTPLPETTLGYDGITQVRRETGWRPEPVPPWSPRDFMPERWAALLVSGELLLATYLEVFSGLGISYCLDLATGAVRWATPPRPTGDRAIAGPGVFLIGEQGYGAFAMRLHDAAGNVTATWPSHGRPLVSHRGRIRVIELDNDASRPQRVRRLHRDGTMSDGPVLTGYDTAGPALSRTGTAVFWRDGALRAAGPELAVRTLYSNPGWTDVERVLLLDDGLVAFFGHREGDFSTCRLMLLRTDLGPLDDGAWPCGEGNVRANPVMFR